MTRFASRRLPQSAVIAVTALGLVFGAARTAHAFTLGTANGATPDRSARSSDANKKADKKNDNKAADSLSHEGSFSFSTSGDVSVQFGVRDAHHSFETNYNSTTYGPFIPVGPDGD